MCLGPCVSTSVPIDGSGPHFVSFRSRGDTEEEVHVDNTDERW